MSYCLRKINPWKKYKKSLKSPRKVLESENSQEIPGWKKANMDEIKEYLNVDWEHQFEGKNTYLCWNEFKTLLHDCVKNNVPMKKRRTKSDKQVWMTREIV